MSDLNKRLQLGPQAPPKKEEVVTEEPEVEKEKAPLLDARKGRARGPARRAPAKSPTPATQAPVEKSSVCGICTPSTLWQIDPEEDTLQVSSVEEEAIPESKATESEAPALSTNIAGESLHTSSEVPDSETPASSPEDIKAEKTEDSLKPSTTEVAEEDKGVEPVEQSDAKLPAEQQSTSVPDAADEEELAGSTGTLKQDTDKQDTENPGTGKSDKDVTVE